MKDEGPKGPLQGMKDEAGVRRQEAGGGKRRRKWAEEGEEGRKGEEAEMGGREERRLARSGVSFYNASGKGLPIHATAHQPATLVTCHLPPVTGHVTF